jgi:hypothetical protein
MPSMHGNAVRQPSYQPSYQSLPCDECRPHSLFELLPCRGGVPHVINCCMVRVAMRPKGEDAAWALFVET